MKWDETNQQIKCVSADVIPNVFNFTDLTAQELSTLVTSNSLTISGFLGAIPISITGDGSPQMSINGGAWVTSGTIEPGNSLQLRLTTSASYDTPYTVTVNAGIIEQWTARTRLDGFPSGYVVASGDHYGQGCPPSYSSCGSTLPITSTHTDQCSSRAAHHVAVQTGYNTGCYDGSPPSTGTCQIVCN